MTRRSKFERDLTDIVAGRRVVVGLSGGLDSVVLLNALVRGGADVRAAHVDHGLRADSEDDAAFCANVAANLGIPFASARLTIEPGNSLQGRARTQRYAALVRLGAELGADVLAVAHHADDAWESVQLQTARGAGPVGAAGPRRWSSWWGFDIARPLLHVRRAEIERYADQRGLRWREDPSNHDARFARARLREHPSTLDFATLQAGRERADELDDRAALVATSRTPTQTAFQRAELAALKDGVRARALLDAARDLHGELPRPVVTEVCNAIADESPNPRWFCGRRVAVAVSSGTVTVVATRGQGTRLIDERATPTVPLTPDADVPWFSHRISVVDEPTSAPNIGLAHLDGVTLRGPLAGARIATRRGERRLVEVLQELDVPPEHRWCWPCLYVHDRCLAVLGGAIADDESILLQHANKSGIFVQWQCFVPCDFEVPPVKSRS